MARQSRIEIESFLNEHSLSELYGIDTQAASKLFDKDNGEGKKIILESLQIVEEYKKNTQKKCSISSRRKMSRDLGKAVNALSLLDLIAVKHQYTGNAQACGIVLQLVQNCHTQNVFEIQKHDANIALTLSVILGIVSITVSLLSYLKPLSPTPEPPTIPECISHPTCSTEAHPIDTSKSTISIHAVMKEERMPTDTSTTQ